MANEGSTKRYPLCSEFLRGQGKAYPRTCAECQLGPCKLNPPKRSTKPTYSELEAELAEAKRIGLANLLHDTEEIERLESELAGVRGLLQRQWISVEERSPWSGAFYIKRGDQYQCQFRDMILYVTNSGTEEKFAEQWCADFNKRLSEHNAEILTEKAKELAQRVWMKLTDPVPPTVPQSSELVSQGAESADIGKLDTADKSGVEMGKVNRVEEKPSLEDLIAKITPENIHKGEWASAETGGEKAAASPQLVIACLEEAIELFELDDEVNTPGADPWLWKLKSEQALIAYAEAEASPTFRRRSQNQTVSGGVEGAHEGTTADKKGESGEPEKLNNAQKCECGHSPHTDRCTAEVHTITSGLKVQCECAESSISSPPKEKE